MHKGLFTLIILVLFLTITIPLESTACTNLLVTKGASIDGSVMITYTCDGKFHPHLRSKPAADYKPQDSLEISDWKGNVIGKIKQVDHTYAYVGLMNEHQLAISETTFEGREELRNPNGILDYWNLMLLALQRAKTAKEAIMVMTNLVDEYGYRSTGESFSIADTKEAWILEMIGPGPEGQGAIWVAVKIPDGYISCHANKARIGKFPLNNPKNCLYSKNVISFAKKRGYYDSLSKEPFLFNEAYCPSTPKNRRYADTRVWSIFRRAAPSKNFSADFNRSVKGAKPYPLWIKPDKKLSVSDIFSLMRDHYENTDYDMTKGIDAGPYNTPNRWRPLSWTVDSAKYIWERPISTQQTGYSFVSQSRSKLPNPIGGILWYGVDDTYMTCYTPLYCGINSIPESFTKGSLSKFSQESAWWVFNFVSNFVNLKYSFMAPEVLVVQSEIENMLLDLQPAVEKTAIELYKNNKKLMTRYLTNYSIMHAELAVKRWRELGEYLITKYNDGYVQDENGKPQEKGYPESWIKRVLESRPNQFRLKTKEKEIPESKLID